MRCGDAVRRRRTSPVVNMPRIIDPQTVIAKNSGYSAVFMVLPNPLAAMSEALSASALAVSITATLWFASMSLADAAAAFDASNRSPTLGFSI